MHTHKHTYSKHTPRCSIVRRVCQTARELQPTLTASANRLRSAPASLFETSLSQSNWLKPEQVVILFQRMFWKSKATLRLFTYTNLSIKLLLRVSGRAFLGFTLSQQAQQALIVLNEIRKPEKRLSGELFNQAHIQGTKLRTIRFFTTKYHSLFKPHHHFFPSAAH